MSFGHLEVEGPRELEALWKTWRGCHLLVSHLFPIPNGICCFAEVISADPGLTAWHCPCWGSAEGIMGARCSAPGTERSPTCWGFAVPPAYSICVQEKPKTEPQQVLSSLYPSHGYEKESLIIVKDKNKKAAVI